MVEKKLRTNMNKNSATARMHDLFSGYHTIPSRHDLKWIIKENQKVAVQHVLSAVRPMVLKEHLESDLSFSHHELKKDFNKFLAHDIKLAEAFQLVDAGKGRKRKEKRDGTRLGNTPSTSDSGSGKAPATRTDSSNKKTPKSNSKAPICLWPPHKAKGVRNRVKYCPECPEDEKKKLLAEHIASFSEDGPATRTRGKPSSSGDAKPTVGRLGQKQIDVKDSPSCSVTAYNEDRRQSVEGTARSGDGSDDSIVSAKLAEAAVMKGIGSFRSIDTVSIEVALKKDTLAEVFHFSRVWNVPRLVLQLSSGRLALKNVSFLVADDELSCEDLLIGLPVLHQLELDTRTLLERNRAILDGTDCSSVGNPAAVTLPRRARPVLSDV